MLQTRTITDREHETRNILQAIALWRELGDSEHDIRSELLFQGRSEEEILELMKPLTEQNLSEVPAGHDARLLAILSNIAADVTQIKKELTELRKQLGQGLN